MRLTALILLAGCGGPDEPPPGVGTTSTTDPGCVDTFAPYPIPDGGGGETGAAPPLEDALPTLLSETILYEDIAAKAVHPALQPFTPAYELWSDDADKQRWVYLPECATVDTTAIDDWTLPVGATLFKEFSFGGKRVETRIITRLGEGPREFAMASYLWDAAESDATRVGPEGLVDVAGTHDIPSKAACQRCHGSFATGGGRPSRALGFSAIQLAHDGEGLTLDALVADGRLSTAPPTVAIPGDDVERAALGYLHANCGHCHNATPDRVPQVDLELWVDVGTTDVAATGAYQTAVGVPNTLFNDQHVTGRVVPGDPAHSAVFYRMSARGSIAQMPPVGSEVADTAGIDLVRAWIEALP